MDISEISKKLYRSASVTTLVLVGAFALGGISAGRLLCHFQKPMYGYYGLLEVPLIREQVLARASAVKSYLQLHAQANPVKGGSFRTILVENDSNMFVEMTTYGETLEVAKAVLDNALDAVKKELGGPIAQLKKESADILDGLAKKRTAIEEKLAALPQVEGGGINALPVAHEGLFYRWQLANLDEQENTFRKEMLSKRTGEFHFVHQMPMSADPILPNRGRWSLFGALLGLCVGLLVAAAVQNIKWRRSPVPEPR